MVPLVREDDVAPLGHRRQDGDVGEIAAREVERPLGALEAAQTAASRALNASRSPRSRREPVLPQPSRAAACGACARSRAGASDRFEVVVRGEVDAGRRPERAQQARVPPFGQTARARALRATYRHHVSSWIGTRDLGSRPGTASSPARSQPVWLLEPHAQLVEQPPSCVGAGVRRRQQAIAEEDRVGAGEKAERLRLVGQRQTAGAQADRSRRASGCARSRSCAPARTDPPAADRRAACPSTRTSRFTGTLSGCGSSAASCRSRP